jgi:2-oxoglutarate dehydrogenase E2 component (dihydrolipoamide succinyltransferase)
MPVQVITVIMPQMGESITEATISAWRKCVGDQVQEGESLLDISTAKVESEIPAPASGLLAALVAEEGSTVPVDAVIALIVPVGTNLATFDTTPWLTQRTAAADGAVQPAPERTPNPVVQAPVPPATPSPDVPPRRKPAPPPVEVVAEAEESFADLEHERRSRVKRRSTPLVRNIAQDLGIDIESIPGSGANGRVTKRDVESFLAEQKQLEKIQGTLPSITPRPPEDRPAPKLRPGQMRMDTVATPPRGAEDIPAEYTTVSLMRRQIAENLTRSAQTIPHAYTCHEVDFTQLEKLRLRYKPVFETQFNTRLTPLVFLVSAVSDALLKFRSINATWGGDRIQKHRVVNIGIAVALREGLVVPVLKNVEAMSLAGIARGLVDISTRARHNQLRASDMEGGTFSITSPGQLGATLAIPIIMPPQGGIIHLGAIQKVPCVVTGPDGQDSIAIRQRAMMTLGIDHRLIDGWEADQFMIAIKERIERADFGLPA